MGGGVTGGEGGFGDGRGERVGCGPFVGSGSFVGSTVGVGSGASVGSAVGVGGGAGVSAGGGADGVSFGNPGWSNRYLPGSSPIALAASVMNCCQIGPGWLAPNTSYPPPLVRNGLPSVVPSHTAAAIAPV